MCACPTAEIRWAPSYAGRRQHRRQRRTRGARRRRHVGQVERAECGLERQQDLDLARVVLAELGGELVEHLDVREQLADLRPDLHDGGGHQAIDGVGRGGDLVAEPGRAPPGQHVRVGGGLDVELHRLARSDGNPVVERVQRLHVGAVGPVHEPLGLEPGHVPLEAEVHDELGVQRRPRAPRRSAGTTWSPTPDPTRRRSRRRRTSGSSRRREGHRLADRPVGCGRYVPGLDSQVRDVSPLRWPDVLVDQPAQPAPDLAASVVHPCTLSTWSLRCAAG